MLRLWRSLWILAAFLLAFPLSAEAAVKSYDQLSAQQITALQDSEGRLMRLDATLQALDQEYAYKKISRAAYARDRRDLIAYITEEAQFQNAVLIGQSKFSEKTQKILNTIGHVAAELPALLAEMVIYGGRAFAH